MTNSPVVFCASCTQALTSTCIISGRHRNHRLVDLQEAVQKKVEKMKKASEDLESNSKKFADIEPKIKIAKQTLEDMCQRTEELLNREYNALSVLLDHNKQKAFRLLNNHKEAMKRELHQLNEDTQNFKSKSTRVVEDIQQLRNRQEDENSASLLGEISAMETSLATINEFYSTVNDKLKLDHSRLEALENSVKKIVEKNKELLPRPWEFLEQITLDDSSRQENVKISEDRTEMRVGPRFGARNMVSSSWSSVLGTQKYKNGQHYWEVKVRGLKSWAVGVAEQRHLGKDFQSKPLGQDKNSWVLECEGGELTALHNNEYVNLKDSDVHTVGVFVDCDNKRVKFYNVSTGMVMHSFVTKFKGHIQPIFSIQAQKGTDTRLKICSLTDRDSANNESDTESEHRISTDSAYNSS